MIYNLEKIVQAALSALNSTHSQHAKDFELELRRALMQEFCSDAHTNTISAKNVMDTWKPSDGTGNNPTSQKTIIHG